MAFEPSPLERLAIARIERRRSFLTPPRQTAIQPTLDQVTRRLARSVRRDSALEAAWRGIAPPDVSARVRAIGLNAGVLTMSAPDRSAGFVADRFLKSGGRAALASALGVAITRVVVKTDHAAVPSQADSGSTKPRAKRAASAPAPRPPSGPTPRRRTKPPPQP